LIAEVKIRFAENVLERNDITEAHGLSPIALATGEGAQRLGKRDC